MRRDVVFLVALPASGKSEIRRFLDHLSPVEAADLDLGRIVHLDDYPYVHFMRRAAEEAATLGLDPIFFRSADRPFIDAREWTTLSRLLDEDVRAVLDGDPLRASDAAGLFERLDRIRVDLGLGPVVGGRSVATGLDVEARDIADGVARAVDEWSDGDCTLIVEFARGGPQGASMPLDAPYGTAHALACFAPAVLGRSAVLAVRVDPEESRRRNRARAIPGREGDASILHHGVPEAVMRGEYGVDDVGWLVDRSRLAGTIDVATSEGLIALPATRIDNRDDLTSHLRGDPATWDADRRAELHRRLTHGFRILRGEMSPDVRRFEYGRSLRGELPVAPDVDLEFRTPTEHDAEALAVLMDDAYRGTIDHDGETIVEARQEVATYLSGEAMLHMSVVADDADRIVGACLVSWIPDRPLVGYVMTAASHKSRGLATALVSRSLRLLAADGHGTVSAWITEGNVASETVLRRLGFTRAGLRG